MNNILDCLKDASSIIIAGHTRPDGDCVGSCMGMYHYIRDNYPEKDVQVRLEKIPDAYSLIPDSQDIISDYSDDRTFDLFISIDVSDKERLAGAIKYFDSAKHRICIDHHISNKGFADQNLILPQASSASEVLCDLFDHERISYKAAFALYVGIICDSGVFKYSCTSRHTMEVGGMLIDKGIPYTQLIDSVFYEKTFLQNQLLGYCLLNSKLSLGGKMISCYIDSSVMDRFGAVHSDLEGVVSQMKLTKGVEVSLFVTSSEPGIFRLSLRSSGKVDVRAVAAYYGGGGHTLAAGATAYGEADTIIDQVENMIKEQLS